MNLYDEFEWRGMLYEATPGMRVALGQEKVTAYIGFDPSAPSLHVGSLLPIMGLARLQRLGHTPIAIAGGGTGLIGDPSGKTKERMLLTSEQVEENLLGIKEQLSHFLDFNAQENPARIVNNADWLAPITMMEFLRDVGKYFTVNNLLGKEAISRRLGSDEGISFTEFSYPLLQAYDYLKLFDQYNCTLQMGGSDQWGNILAGIDLIRRLRGARAHGLVFPLVTTTAGIKFGKTEAGAVWLDAKLTSPYRFYQFWLNTDDRDVVTYLKFFTWLLKDEIDELEESVKMAPEKREAQRRLAREVTALLHGQTELEKAVRASEVLFGKEMTGLTVDQIVDIFADVPSTEIEKSKVESDGFTLSDALVLAGLVPSKGEAKRLVQGGGVAVNNVRADDPRKAISASDFIDGQVLVLRKGAKHYHLIRIAN
ncbi:MAG TPA: tyrosine--tRNA ligase [Pyrinomonadaceae bacterium]|nr:tyrosine--tRNA ligase [Pyrinomonadaceae bacterium]